MIKIRFAPLRALGAICVLALLLFSAGASAQNAKGRTITGSVLDVDGKPVPHATVAVGGGGPSATTGDDGSFTLAGVATTNLVLEVTADGFTARQVPVLGAPTALQLSVVLAKPAPAPPAPPPAAETRMIGGVVSDASHAPIANATVRVHGTTIQTVTAADGSFTLPGVAVTEVTLDVEAPNQPPTSVTLPADKAAVAITVGAASTPAAPTTRTIRGKVTDPSTGEPIVAAQIQVAGTGAVVFSEADGTFKLEGLPPGPAKLDISAPEHESHLLEVPADKDSIDIPLALSKGEQIVIEGRAPVIVKANLANGASVVDGKDLNRVSAATLDDAMTAKLPGANMQSNSGAPGGGAQLRLRGISTINGQSSPLYVIDGVVISNVSTSNGSNAITLAQAGGNASTQDNPTNRVADLNPNDIETLEVLKGASAAALYGSKASNGVVVITTKRGRNGENHATVTQRIGVSQVSKTLGARRFASLDEVKKTFCDLKNHPEVCDMSPYVQAYMASGGHAFNHEAEIERSPFLRETLGSVSGGTENGNYFASALLTDQPGVVKGTFYEKQSGRLAISFRFGDRVRLGMTANLIHSLSDRGLVNNDNTGTSDWVALSSTPEFQDLRPVKGVFPANVGVGVGTNPLQTVALLQNREEILRLISGSTISVDAYSSRDGASKVKVLGNVGIDAFTQRNNLVSPNALIYEPTDDFPGTLIDGNTKNINWNVGAGAVWTYRPESGKYRSALSGGITLESVDLRSTYLVSSNLNSSNLTVDSGTKNDSQENNLRTKESGLYLQEEIAVLDDRLSILGGLLAERSSLNGDTAKYFVYPKVATVYSLLGPARKGEPSPLDLFETLRVRAAYGEAGNRPNYTDKFTELNSKGNIDGTPGLTLRNILGDPTIEPERQREFELGVDVVTRDQRVAAELTGYQRNISNLLLQRALPTSIGFTTQFSNGGALRNRGFEAAVSVRPLPSKLIDWTTRGTLTLNRSRITETPGHLPFDITVAGFGTGLGAYRIQEGKSATQIVATINKEGDVVTAGDGEPSFRVGWSNVVNVGDFTFTTLLDWQHGSSIINLTRLLYDGAGNSPDVEAAGMRIASFSAKDPRPYIEDGSFVKLREVSIGYTLPKRLVSELGPVKQLQISASGRNLLTFSGYSGLDPEVSNFGGQPIGRNYDVAPYPPSRSFWLSITAGL
ncbi:MAG TPA: SusC/RagA family TonB-linked outer membrane protein [Kofleriaceae bacterium]|nr:SusC/RagA family TonB-linked outer membrane protein [Kofleriaceae bacterium]